jgi:hypothetical protein
VWSPDSLQGPGNILPLLAEKYLGSFGTQLLLFRYLYGNSQERLSTFFLVHAEAYPAVAKTRAQAEARRRLHHLLYIFDTYHIS